MNKFLVFVTISWWDCCALGMVISRRKTQFHLPSLKNIFLLYHISQNRIWSPLILLQCSAKSINFWGKKDRVSNNTVSYLLGGVLCLTLSLGEVKSSNSKYIRYCVKSSAYIPWFNFYSKLLPCVLVFSVCLIKRKWIWDKKSLSNLFKVI